MEQNHDPFTPESKTAAGQPATDEPAYPSNVIVEDEGPVFATEAERAAYWQGVTQGIRDAGREPGHPHLPADFSLDLTRDGAAPSLTSAKLLDVWPHNPHDADPPLPEDPATRHDGWDPVKERLFLTTLADTGVVADACRACGMSRPGAYKRRRSASGRAFALGWDAALLLARAPVADDVMSRARHGVIDRVYRNGELVAERHHYDNRLTMAVLTRLDRQAEGLGENAPVIRVIAQEFDRFLDLLPDGTKGAERFLACRFPANRDGTPRPAQEPVPDNEDLELLAGGERALLCRLGGYQRHGVGLPEEADLDDLDPAEMASWTPEQIDRANFSGFLCLLGREQWPQSVREGGGDGTDGKCHLRQLYRRYFPRSEEAEAGFGLDGDDDVGKE